MSQVSDDLTRAMEILEERGWCQGVHEAPDGRVCAEAAVIRAVEGDRVRMAHEVRDWGRLERYVEYVPGYIDGALFELPRIAFRHPLIGHVYGNLDRRRATRVYDAHEALRRHMPEDARAGAVNLYNDAPMTSVEDVKLMFKRAIEACDE